MIKSQLRPSGITNERLLSALKEIPREIFLPSELQYRAYQDQEIIFENGRFLLNPLSFANLIQTSELKPHDRILDIGCTTGYSTAVLSFLTHTVIGTENDDTMVEMATKNLATLGSTNARVYRSDLKLGYPDEEPYDVIFIHGAVETIPEGLLCQLSEEGGRLVTIQGTSELLISRFENKYSKTSLGNMIASPLPEFKREKSFKF